MKVFVFDAMYCNGCHNCQVACKDEHVGNEWLPYAKPQPTAGDFWCRVEQTEHGQTPMVKVEYRPVFGAQNPELAAYAPEVLMDREDGLIVIEPEKAAGRKDIADKFDGVFWNEELQIPQGCTGCAHLVDEGKLTHCVDLCSTGALSFGDLEEFADVLANARTVEDVNGNPPAEGTRVYYLNAPRLFLGGEVWDKEADEDIEGAKVVLSNADGEVAAVETDDFGDFKIEYLDAGAYQLHIEAEGFAPVDQDVQLDKSLFLGDFPLVRA